MCYMLFTFHTGQEMVAGSWHTASTCTIKFSTSNIVRDRAASIYSSSSYAHMGIKLLVGPYSTLCSRSQNVCITSSTSSHSQSSRVKALQRAVRGDVMMSMLCLLHRTGMYMLGPVLANCVYPAWRRVAGYERAVTCMLLARA
eukprot:scpid82771/ scgid7727/ 